MTVVYSAITLIVNRVGLDSDRFICLNSKKQERPIMMKGRVRRRDFPSELGMVEAQQRTFSEGHPGVAI